VPDGVTDFLGKKCARDVYRGGEILHFTCQSPVKKKISFLYKNKQSFSHDIVRNKPINKKPTIK
jgi:hypothetical protein